MKDLTEITHKLKEIRDMGYVSTVRAHAGGVGNTLETLLGIKENNIIGPDIGVIELKAKRISSNSMLTLAGKSPDPRGINRILFENYGYLDESGCRNLHCTIVGSGYNPQLFKLTIADDRLVIENKSQIEAYWPMSVCEDVLTFKVAKLLLVFAETKGESNTKDEKFHYIEAHLLSGIKRDRFVAAIRNDKLKVDIRIGSYRTGQKKGQYHDHGTVFRILKQDFEQLFDKYERLM